VRLALLLISSLVGTAIWAHDLYLVPQKYHAAAGDSILLSVHTGDSFPQSEQGVDPARLTSAPAMPEGSWRILGKATHATVKLDNAGGHLFGVWTKPRMLTLEAPKFEAYLREEGLRSALQTRAEKGESAKMGREMYAKFAKTYVVAAESDGNYAKPLGLKIEFVPQTDPAQAKPGDEVPFVVLYDGKPLADVQVEAAFASTPMAKGQHSILGRTDASGRIVVKIPAAGRMRLHCVQMERVEAATHEWESFWASFTIEVKGASVEASGLSARR
jgi:uncharacterized GH25 family protein